MMNFEVYFDKNLNIPNDDTMYLSVTEPVILDEYPDFQIFRNGRIVDLKNMNRKPVLEKGRYLYFNIWNKRVRVHTLVANAYLKNPNNYKFVNHRNNDSLDNSVENLEWINNKTNNLHAELFHQQYDNRNFSKIPNGISLTSENYRKFIIRKVKYESLFRPDYWIFSNKEPFSLLFFLLFFKQNNFLKFNKPKFISDNSYLNSLSKTEKFILMTRLLKRHSEPIDQNDHIVNLLNELHINLEEYVFWIMGNNWSKMNGVQLFGQNVDGDSWEYDPAGFLFIKELLLFNNHRNLYYNSELTPQFDNGLLNTDAHYNRRFENDYGRLFELSRYEKVFDSHMGIERFKILVNKYVLDFVDINNLPTDVDQLFRITESRIIEEERVRIFEVGEKEYFHLGSTYRVRCSGTLDSGERCGEEVRNRDYCPQHDPAKRRCNGITKSGERCKLVLFIGEFCKNHKSQN